MARPPAHPAPDETPAPSEEAAASAPSDGDPRDDADLVRAAQGGSEEAFAVLVRRHQRRALRVARHLVPSDEDALDLVQDAFLRVFKSLDRFDFRHEFRTWLYRIVTNLGIDFLRRRRPSTSTSGTSGSGDDEAEIDLVDHDAPEPARRMEAEETAAQVRACIDALAPHFRDVLILRELEGLPCTEIAAIVGATHVTVRWRLHRGRRLFQEEWERRRARAARTGSVELGANTGAGDDVAWMEGSGAPSGSPHEGSERELDRE